MREITLLAGIGTFIELFIPALHTAGGEAGGPITSGIWIANGPEANVVVAGNAALVNDKGMIDPVQIVADGGLTNAINGVTVSVATLEKSTAVQGPDIKPRYW